MTEQTIAEHTIEVPDIRPDWDDLMARFFRWAPYDRKVSPEHVSIMLKTPRFVIEEIESGDILQSWSQRKGYEP